MKFINLILLMCVCFLGACVSDGEEPRSLLDVGDPLPQFTLTLSDGQLLSAEELHTGSWIIILFNTDCPDCRRELPILEQEYLESIAEDSPLNFVCIAREESAESIARFWQSHDLTMPYPPQPDRRIYSLFATAGIPRVYRSSDGIITRAD